MTIEQQTSASASFVASAPVSIDIAALNVDIGSSGSCRCSDIDDPRSVWVRLTGGEFHGKGTTGGRAKRFSIPVFCPTPTDVRIGFSASAWRAIPALSRGPATAPAASA